MGKEAITVSDLTRLIKNIIEGSALLTNVYVKGEISSFKMHSSGHVYFTLKDKAAIVKCVMFRSSAAGLKFQPEEGAMVIAMGSISVYEPSGQYQLYVRQLVPDGVGEMYAALENLKAKLAAEGLFAEERKKQLPFLPAAIGVVTSRTGAAIHDILSVVKRRFPGMPVILYPAVVQGAEGAASVVAALEELQKNDMIDVVIIGRGGGAKEELFLFNDERIVRAVAACPLPVISAVGHDIDYTLCDLAADVRAATPTAAAEIAVPVKADIEAAVLAYLTKIKMSLTRRISLQTARIDVLQKRLLNNGPAPALRRSIQRLDEYEEVIGKEIARLVNESTARLAKTVAGLEAMNPLAVLARGYAVCKNEQGQVIINAADIAVDETIDIVLHQGYLSAIVSDRRD